MSWNFDDIKEGDQVALPGLTYGLGQTGAGKVLTVEKVTKTQFVAGGIRFLKNGGHQVGTCSDPWSQAPCAVRATPERLAQVQEANAFREADNRARLLANLLETRLHALRRDRRSIAETTAILQQLSTLLQPAVDLLPPSDKEQ
jgi:hypothetical protein